MPNQHNDSSVIHGTGRVELKLESSNKEYCQNSCRIANTIEFEFIPRLRISISHTGGAQYAARNLESEIASRRTIHMINSNNHMLTLGFNQQAHSFASAGKILCSMFTTPHGLSKIPRIAWMSNVIAPWNIDASTTSTKPVLFRNKRFVSHFMSTSKVPKRQAKQNETSVCSTKTIQLPVKFSKPITLLPVKKVSPESLDENVTNNGQSVFTLITRFSHISEDTRFAHYRPRKDVNNSKLSTSTQKLQLASNIEDEDRLSPKPNIPQFYFPFGKCSSEEIRRTEIRLAKVKKLFDSNKGGCIGFNEFPELMKVLELPLYWKSALYRATGAKKKESVSFEAFSVLWIKIAKTYHDQASRLFFLLSFHRNQNFLEPCDWENLILDVVNTHPGLRFLKEAKEFISRYCKTVIARIYFTVNRSLSDKISLQELKNSNLIEMINHLEEEDDINKFTEYFSYEHFYVIYCKFWEIDRDHDLYVSREDLYMHNQNAISKRVIDRIFSGAVSSSAEIKRGLMSYYEFVWFIIAEEGKRSRSSIEYWFRCLDIDGDGYLSMYELEYFYQEQMQRMEAFGFEFMQFEDVICQMLDLLKPIDRTKIRLMDLKRCKLVNVFLDTFINTEKYLEHDQRDPFASFRGPDVLEVDEWVRYAADEYENLLSDEQIPSNSDDLLDEEEMKCSDTNSPSNLSYNDDNGSQNETYPSGYKKTPHLMNTSTL